MKDKLDDRTVDFIPQKPKRGRPSTGFAMTAAEKQAAYRARKAALTVTVTFNREHINYLQTLINAGAEHIYEVDTVLVEHIREAIHRAKKHEKTA